MEQARKQGASLGFTLVEMMIAVTVFAVVAITLLQHLTISYSSTRSHRDRVFAYTKAQAILSEMHAVVVSNSSAAAIDLDVYDDGSWSNPVLSIAEKNGAPIPADHPLSGNHTTINGWQWYRRIKVRPFAGLNNRNVRYVTVKIFKRAPDGDETEIASLSSVINSISSGFPTTQVYDVYLLAIENIPGWWVFMENIVPSVEAAITDLESRNPGLSLRTHWITKASYGRNQQYKPFINSAVDSNQVVPLVYYYPGTMPAGSASNYYYVPSMMKGRMNQDGMEINGYDPDLNPYPYALADFYNHGMRLHQERALHDQRVAAVRARKAAITAAIQAGGTPPDELTDMSEEPTLRLLLEDMCTDPDKFRHALVINLHGELMPMPSIRNYSDPAKTTVFPGLRAVTHPEEIFTVKGNSASQSQDAYLRVYAYSSDPSTFYTFAEPVAFTIMIDFMDVNLLGTLKTGTNSYYPFHDDGFVRAMYGGVTVFGDNKYPPVGMNDPAFPPALNYFEAPYPWSPERQMRYYVWFGTMPNGRKFTRMYLFNTPVRSDVIAGVPGNQGLYNNDRSRLYGLEYNPAPTRDTDFTRDLAAAGDGPKNTARWRIKLPRQLLFQGARWYNEDGTPAGAPGENARMTVRTFIYDGSTPWPEQPGKMFPVAQQPDNLSETYVYWGRTKTSVPFTERSQFCGDPRFNPYKDLLNGSSDFPDGYNWFFGNYNLDIATDFPGVVRKINLWNAQVRQDAPRYFELLRTALVNSGSVYTTLTGFSYYYMGHGNEIGYDSANGYPNSIPTHLRPFGDPLDGTGYVNNITGFRRYIREAKGTPDFWFGMPWLGELYPDQYRADYASIGNLRAGITAAGLFYRSRDADCHLQSTKYNSHGLVLDPARQRTSEQGCVSFMNNGTSTQHFNHHFTNGSGPLVGAGLELANNYNFPLPATIDVTRAFSVDTGNNVPAEWGFAPYSTNRFFASVLREYYDFGAQTGSGLVLLEDPAKVNGAYVIVSGVAQTTTLGSSFIAKYSVLAMLQSFFEVGATSMTHRIKQAPRVEVKAPTELTELLNPLSINLQWDTTWVRWDGQKYTASTPTTFAEDETEIDYSIMYSDDNGTNWKQLQLTGGVLEVSSTFATPGTKPAAGFLIADATNGQENYVWNTPSTTFPEAAYLVRIEAYRRNQQLHYSHHTQRFYIDR